MIHPQKLVIYQYYYWTLHNYQLKQSRWLSQMIQPITCRIIVFIHVDRNILNIFKMMRLLVLLLAAVSVLSLQVSFSEHYASTPAIDVAALRTVELQKHNSYRALHGCPPIRLSNTLNNVAQNYANTIANNHKMTHSKGKYGENLYWAWGKPTLTYTPGKASDSWYAEEKYYSYSSFKSKYSNKQVGHFTAMIWKSVTSVGFGYKVVPENGGYAIYVVANYSPVPNMQGQYAANVPRKL